jgi:hypothetical protein
MDDSGTSGLPIVTIGALVAHISKWEEMEPAFEEIMSWYEVPLFHAKEFHDTKGCFAGWKRIKKRGFTDEIFSVAHNQTMGIAHSMRRAPFLAMKKESGLYQNMSPYGACFSNLMNQIVTHDFLWKAVREEGISLLIETGNANNIEVKQFFEAVESWDVYEGCLKSISFIPKRSCRAIQVADFFAFYARRDLQNNDRIMGKLVLPMSDYLAIMDKQIPLLMWSTVGFEPGDDKTLWDAKDLETFKAKITPRP